MRSVSDWPFMAEMLKKKSDTLEAVNILVPGKVFLLQRVWLTVFTKLAWG